MSRRNAPDQPPAEAEERVHRWLRRGEYRVHSLEHDHEGKRLRGVRVIYSFWSATKYVLILSILLWWLPLFGQMIAGYVGGRRAGSPWKGVLAAVLPLVMIFVIVSSVQPGTPFGTLFEEAFGVALQPAAILAAVSDNVPLLAPYIQFSTEYLQSFVSALEGQSPYEMNSYILTIAFAYIGGIMAEQSRREIEASAGTVSSHTTIIVPAEPTPVAEDVDPEAYHRFARRRPAGLLARLIGHGDGQALPEGVPMGSAAISGAMRYERMRGYLPDGARWRRRREEPPPPPPEDEDEYFVPHPLHPAAPQGRPSGHQPRLRPPSPEPVRPRGPHGGWGEPRRHDPERAGMLSTAYLPQKRHHRYHGEPPRVDMHDRRAVHKLEKRLDREWGSRRGGFIARALGAPPPSGQRHALQEQRQQEERRRRPPNDWEQI